MFFFPVNFATFLSTPFLQKEAATRGVLEEKVFLEISQNSQENTCAKVAGLRPEVAL